MKKTKHFEVYGLSQKLANMQIGESIILPVSKESDITKAQRLLTATMANVDASFKQAGMKCVPVHGHVVTDAIYVTRTE